MNALCRFLACGALCLLAALAQAQEGGHGVDAHQGLDAQRHHPSQDQPLHETFYSKWHMPDNLPPVAATRQTATRQKSSLLTAKSTQSVGKTGSTFPFRPKRWS
jgi:hypothetical protein